MSVTREGHILIAGGSGLIGTRLSRLLADKGYDVRILTRGNKTKGRYKSYQWDPSMKKLDPESLRGAKAIINLAGSGIADHRWTRKYKQEILHSRLAAASTLMRAMDEHQDIKVYVAASAIGFYGNSGDDVLTENSPAGKGFLPETTEMWETASENCPVRRVVIRTGLVLTANGGALPPFARMVKAMIAPVIDGNQYMSWIHIDDLCGMYIEAIENEQWKGTYNAVTPEPLQQRDFISTLKSVMNPMAFTFPVPPAFIRFLLGEQSHLILDSARVIPEHAQAHNFQFRFLMLDDALKNLYGRS